LKRHPYRRIHGTDALDDRTLDMTTSRHHAAPMRARRHWTTDRIISAGLAVTACAGIVGVIGVRSIEESAAAQATPASDSGTETTAVSSAGLTEAQLDEYAAQLQAEAAHLDAYRVKLAKAAKALASAPRPAAKTSPRPATTKAAPKPVAKPAPKPAPKPVAKPAPKPAAKPQSHTKSS
jgi:hypothetical protein